MERNESSSLACSRLTRLAINPPLIARQRVDLALKVFSSETSAALQLAGYHDIATFVLLVSKYITITNAKSLLGGIHLRDNLRQPIRNMECESIIFLRSFSDMVEENPVISL